MTYNFDPQGWYDRELRLLDMERKQGAIDSRQYAAAVDELERRYEQMVSRLDGTYQLPSSRSG